ncbi:MAG: DUF4258 domain-containing protein [Fibromonadales bacterium]|nr:DUF4258 domain-containing protein [Fibromonadales bacterium]
MRFTKHALERMRERGISEKQVLTALANSVSFSSSKCLTLPCKSF